MRATFLIFQWGIVFITMVFLAQRVSKKWFGAGNSILGVLLFLLSWTYLYWILGFIAPVLGTYLSVLGTFLITGALFYGLGRGEVDCVEKDWNDLTLFSIFFLAGLWIRSYSPFLDVAERLPDTMFFTSLLSTASFPPSDLWLSGYTLNYYYFGQLLFVPWTKLANIPAEYALNLATCTIWGLIASSVYATVRIVSHSKWAGWIAALSSSFFSNWYWIYEWATKGWDKRWWWESSRAIPNTITEFPFFSFLLGDFHAHFIAIPWLSLTFAMSLMVRKGLNLIPFLLFMSLSLGAHYAMNPWEFPWMVLLLLFMTGRNWKKALGLFLASLLLFAPFWMTYERPVSYFGWVPFGYRSPPGFFLLHWALFLSPTILLLYLNEDRFFKWKEWLLEERVLFLLCLFMIVFCEFFHLDNLYGEKLMRQNTVFKFYTVAWWGLSISLPLMFWRDREHWLRRKWTFALLAFVGVMSLGYPFFFAPSRLVHSTLTPTLNGVGDWKSNYPGDVEAIEWVRKHTDPGDVILEATGPAYHRFGRISALTGRPTILGWENHERVWRRNGGDLTQDRLSDFKLKPLDALIYAYHLKWAVIGDLEETHLPPHLLKGVQRYPRVFESHAVSVFNLSTKRSANSIE